MQTNSDAKETAVIQSNLSSKSLQFISRGKQEEAALQALSIFIPDQCSPVPALVRRDVPCHIAEDIFPNAAGTATCK